MMKVPTTSSARSYLTTATLAMPEIATLPSHESPILNDITPRFTPNRQNFGAGTLDVTVVKLAQQPRASHSIGKTSGMNMSGLLTIEEIQP